MSCIFNHRANKAWHFVAGAAALLTLAPIGSASAQSLASAGRTSNQVAIGTALDAVSGRTNAARQSQIDAIRALPVALRGSALGQLSPQSYTLLPQLAIQSMDASDTMLHNYIVTRRDIAEEAPATIAMSGARTFHATLMGDVRQATYKSGFDRPRATTDSRSIAFAADFSPIPGAIVGVTLGIDGIDARLDPARPRITYFNSHIGPYASIVRGKVYVDANASYTLSEYKLRRQVEFTGVNDRLRVNQDGDGWAANAETGLMVKRGVARIQPFVGIHYRYADVSGFRETGGISALDVAGYRTQSLRSGVGARVSANVKRGNWALRPSAQAEWRRELLKNPESRMEFRFANGDILNTFTLLPSQLKKDAAYLSAGITATRNSRTSFRLAYTGELANDRHINGFVATISRRF
ncbi:MAG: hypothetical protein JWL66_578 [Sphingomonadales bacterium]|nr:hypothetical protein [Sphingomonadales bacterium]